MSECPICFEDDPDDNTTDCCKQRICKLCLEKCKKSCPFCRSVTIEIEKEVPVTHTGRYERFSVLFCFVFCIVFIIVVCIGMTFAIIENKKFLDARRNLLHKNKTLVYTNDHPT